MSWTMWKPHASNLLYWVCLLTAGAATPPLSAQTAPVLPEAWGQLHFVIPTGRLPSGVPDGVTITLTANDGSYARSISTSNRALMAQAFSQGRFRFTDVPTEIPLLLTIQFESLGRRDVYRSTFRFHEPKLNVIQQFRRAKALNLAGYVGDFELDIQTAKIKARNRFSGR